MYDEKTDLYEMQAENNVKNYNFITAYKSMFLKYSEFSGRSRRSEYWYAYLANYILIIAFVILSALFSFSEALATVMAVLCMLYTFVIIIPALALTVRRLHDTGRSAWWLLIALVPYIGELVLLIFTLLDSQPGTNKYGKNPKGE